jgi:hypothetical protein
MDMDMDIDHRPAALLSQVVGWSAAYSTRTGARTANCEARYKMKLANHAKEATDASAMCHRIAQAWRAWLACRCLCMGMQIISLAPITATPAPSPSRTP